MASSKHGEKVIGWYAERATSLVEQYDALSFEKVHTALLPHLETVMPIGRRAALDIGAGSGRDARWLAKAGYCVTAVEPTAALRAAASQHKDNGAVTLVDDRLPDLPTLAGFEASFDLILVSAVWMHLDHSDRPKALARIAALASRGAIIAISLRRGGVDEARGILEVEREEILPLAAANGLVCLELVDSADTMGRDSVRWTSVILTKRVS